MTQKNKLRVLSLAVAVSLATMSLPMATAGGLQAKMDSVFGDMSNTTKPGVFETQRRGVLGGGSIYVRSPVMNTNLVNFQAPSFKGDCGGIDMFGGSFSFINADQFVQLLRSVASNAKGYAFNIALDIACSECMSWINTLQGKIQKLNEAFGNSCQLSKGIVNDVAGAFGYQRQNEYSLKGTITGLKDDFFGATNDHDGKNTRQEVDEKQPEKAKEIIGNIVWDALKESKANLWVLASAAASSEKEEYGILMAMSGTVVIPKSEPDVKNPDTGNTNNPRYYPPLITFKDIVEGGNIQYYSCADDACLSPTTATVNTVGMASRIQQVLTGHDEGDAWSGGIIRKFNMTSGNAFTTKEANVMSNMPEAIGAIVRNLATASPNEALRVSNEIAYAVAMTWAYSLIRDQLKAVRQTLKTSTKPQVKEVLQQLDTTEEQLERDYYIYSTQHPAVNQIIQQYNETQKNIEKTLVVAYQGLNKRTLGNR